MYVYDLSVYQIGLDWFESLIGYHFHRKLDVDCV
jgi:hypothetical protein